jgi:hypothetical protein
MYTCIQSLHCVVIQRMKYRSVNCFNMYASAICIVINQTMSTVNHYTTLVFIYIFIKFAYGEISPFFIHANRVFIKCADGKLESFDNTTDIHSTCIRTTQFERFNLFQLYIQCPNGRLHLEYNRTFTFNAQVPEYSMASLQPYCFIDQTNNNLNQHQLIPYQTRYTSENNTFTQIISFQCQYNLTIMTNDSYKSTHQFYLFLKLMNYGLCRYMIQFMYSNGTCNRFYQPTYKIQARIKNSICYYQTGLHPPEIPLEYFDYLTSINLSSSEHLFHSTKSFNRTIFIITVSVTVFCLLLCLILLIAMCQLGLFRQ